MSIIEQIKDIVIDAYEDATGQSNTIQTLDTTAIVSMGKEIQNANKYDKFYGSLMNRIVETYFYTRVYETKDRKVLRDEHEYGAFIQKTYPIVPDAVDNPEYNYNAQTGEFEQLSPYAITAKVSIDTKIYGGRGTWSHEFMTPVVQIKTAFLGEAQMAGFIDSQFIAVENKFKVEEESLVAAAVNTGMAYAIENGLARNLLAEYNTAHAGATLTVAQALESADFLRYLSKEIVRAKENFKTMTTVYNVEEYPNFTPEDKLVLEINTEVEKNCEVYLYSDTFHKELVELPNFESVPFWQTSGKNFAFADTSKISIQHDDFVTQENVDGEIEQTGIVAFLHDIDYVAAYFGDRRSWSAYNPRSEVLNSGTKGDKGFAVDGHANALVFYIAEDSNEEGNNESNGEGN